MSEPTRWRKKPIVIEAMQCTDMHSSMTCARWMEANDYPWLTDLCNTEQFDPKALRARGHERDAEPPTAGIYIDPATGLLMIRTLEGDMRVPLGSWVIRGVQGEFYSCEPSVFERSYEPAEE